MKEQIMQVLGSWRFWGVVLTSVGWMFQQPVITSDIIIQCLQLIIGAAVAVRTIDRFSEYSGAAYTGK